MIITSSIINEESEVQKREGICPGDLESLSQLSDLVYYLT